MQNNKMQQIKADLLKWYYDQKSPYLFFLYFESMIYNYLPCQILGHDFNEKSEFLDFELSIKLPAKKCSFYYNLFVHKTLFFFSFYTLMQWKCRNRWTVSNEKHRSIR